MARARKEQEAGSPADEIVDAGEIATPNDPVDPEVQEEFDEARRLGEGHENWYGRKMRQHTSTSPALTAGDVDAAWDRSDVGEEGPGGTVTTPDQDIVEQIGEAVGQTYEDDQPLDDGNKLERRGGPRWEMDPASSEDYRERVSQVSRKPRRRR